MKKDKKIQTNFRWIILGLLFMATTILYLDRSAPGILTPDLQRSIGWIEEQYGIINSVFMMAYAVCFIVMSTLIFKKNRCLCLPLNFPDLTKGDWKARKPYFAI